MQNDLGDEARLKHIFEAIVTIENYTRSYTLKDFSASNLVQDACIRQLAIIGEASNRISENLKSATTSIEWRKMIALRNVLVHEYFGVDVSIIWDIIEVDLPKAKVLVSQALNKFYS